MPSLAVLQGDACQLPLADQSIHTICTSPPYYGLRAYSGLEPTLWAGGSYAPTPGAPPLVIPGPTPEAMAACAHVWGEPLARVQRGHAGDKSTLVGTQTAMLSKEATEQGVTCLMCGCWKGCLGNEPTPSMYIWHTLLWLRECWRVLRNDGVLWLNIGDSSASSGKSGGGMQGERWADHGQDHTGPRGGKWHTTEGYQPGSLCAIPEQVLLAAAADGWVVRNEVVWRKASPMPESVRGSRWEYEKCDCLMPSRYVNGHHKAIHVGHREHKDGLAGTPSSLPNPLCPTCRGTGRTDTLVLRRGSWRHTRGTESVFMLTKQMAYWADGEAVREEATMKPQRRSHGHSMVAGEKYQSFGHVGDKGTRDIPSTDGPSGRNPRNVLIPSPTAADHLTALVAWLQAEAPDVLAAYGDAQVAGHLANVLSPAPSPFSGAHFATFPPGLVEPLIKATCPERCCPVCGTGWAPVVTSEGGRDWHHDRMKANGFPGALNGVAGYKRGQSHEPLNDTQHHTVESYRPTCTHYCACSPPLDNRGPVGFVMCDTCGHLPWSAWHPGVVGDFFAGSGTVGEVARVLRRSCVLVEASPTYTALARQRLGLTALDAWEGKTLAPPAPGTYDHLPLFAGGA